MFIIYPIIFIFHFLLLINNESLLSNLSYSINYLEYFTIIFLDIIVFHFKLVICIKLRTSTYYDNLQVF
jgi:hypothetical protein